MVGRVSKVVARVLEVFHKSIYSSCYRNPDIIINILVILNISFSDNDYTLFKTCPNLYKCPATANPVDFCLEKDAHCDGFGDCPDSKDEISCGMLSETFGDRRQQRLKTNKIPQFPQGCYNLKTECILKQKFTFKSPFMDRENTTFIKNKK